MFTWLSRFKKPNEQKDKQLLEIYNSLNETNKALVDKRANFMITAFITVYAILFLFFAGLIIFLAVLKAGVLTCLLVGICLLLPGYLIWAASTWKKAEPHQKMMLVYTLAIKLNSSQNN